MDITKQSPISLAVCPGLLGIERGLKRVFPMLRTAAYVEIETFIVENILSAMESGLVDAAPIWSNLKTFNPEPFRGLIDILSGGYPCQPFSLAGNRGGLTTQDTFGRIYTQLQRQLDLFAVSSKTSPGTCQWDMTKFTETFEIWVTELRAESTLRQKLARHTRENAFSYLPSWGTPDANLWKGAVSEAGLIRKDGVSRMDRLTNQVVHAPWGTARVASSDHNLNWPTPVTSDAIGGIPIMTQERSGRWTQKRKTGQVFTAKLKDVVVNWPTPVTMDKMGPKTDKALIREKEEIRPGRTSFSNLRDSVVRGTMTDFQPDKVRSSLTGKNRARLNPAWSIQLMGTTLQKIFTVPLAIQLLNKQPK